MPGFTITTENNQTIRFQLYTKEAPVTCEAFLKALPFKAKFYHAKISGEEIWIKDTPTLDIAQENNSVFAEVGEVAIGPINPSRNKISGCMGIFYGEGKLLDGGNIFARVLDKDLPALKQLAGKFGKMAGKCLILMWLFNHSQ